MKRGRIKDVAAGRNCEILPELTRMMFREQNTVELKLELRQERTLRETSLYMYIANKRLKGQRRGKHGPIFECVG